MTLGNFIYLALLPAALMNLFMLWHLHKVRKHDVVLYRFCAIRRDIMQLLRLRGESLPTDDYAAVREYLRMLNGFINGYSKHKTTLLNLRVFVAWVRENAAALKAAKGLPETKDVEIRRLQARARAAVALGFFSYTPFLRSELLLKFATEVASLLGRLGSTYLRMQSQRILTTFGRVQFLQDFLPNRANHA
jgi:hypothetical protein